MAFEDIHKYKKTRSDAVWPRIEAFVRNHATKQTKEWIAKQLGLSGTALAFHCSKHNVSLRVPNRNGEARSRAYQARKLEKARHTELEGPVKLNCDVEGLWRPIRHPKLPIEVRQHYYA